MSQYNVDPLVSDANAGRDATDLKLAPFFPTMNQSGYWKSQPAVAEAERPVGSTAALPPNVEFACLHGKTEFTGPSAASLVPIGDGLQCAACPASFPTNHQLEQHAFANKHKAYLCTCGCEKGFTKRSALRRHVQESTQTREHRCALCDHKFKRPGHVEQHLRLIHNKSRDEMKKLLSTRRAQPRQGSERLSTAAAAVHTTVSMVAQAGCPVIPGGPWNGPSSLYATGTALVEHPGARPGYFPAFFPAPGMAQVTGSPAFTPHNFMVQDPGFPAYHPYPTYPIGALPGPTGVFVNPSPAFSCYPAGPLDGTNNLFHMSPAPVSVDPSDSFGMPDLGADFTMNLSDFDLNTFGI